jgi:hypothetical protein
VDEKEGAPLTRRAARRGTVVVGQIKVRDAGVEGAQHHVTCIGVIVVGPEVVPEAERKCGKFQSAPPAAAVIHGLVAIGVSHAWSSVAVATLEGNVFGAFPVSGQLAALMKFSSHCYG